MKLNVRVYPLKNKNSKTVAMARIDFDGVFVVTSIRIVDGKNGLFVSFPQREKSEGEYEDIAFPATSKAYKYICGEIIKKYKDESKADDDGFVKVDSELPFD